MKIAIKNKLFTVKAKPKYTMAKIIYPVTNNLFLPILSDLFPAGIDIMEALKIKFFDVFPKGFSLLNKILFIIFFYFNKDNKAHIRQE